MAGIGFRLQKLLAKETYTDLVKAYAYSSIISSGPLLIVIIMLAATKKVIESQLGIEDRNVFLGIVIYTYAFSLLGYGFFSFVVTRYLADKYYLNDLQTFTPTFLTTLEFVWGFQAVISGLVLYFLPLSHFVKISVFVLYMSVNGMWLAMIYISAARSYLWVAGSFLIGAVVGFASSALLGQFYGMGGFVLGFALGHMVIFGILAYRIFAEFGYVATHEYDFISYFRRHPYLFLVGVFYYTGLWVDKFIFWYSPNGTPFLSFLHVFNDYDNPMFLATLSIVPSMAFFLVQMETSFFKKYHAFYQGIRNREPIQSIRARKKDMIDNLTLNFKKFVLIQGVLSGAIIMFIYEIANAFFLNQLQIGILRVAILGSFMQMALIMVMTILFYFDFQREAAWLSLIYFLTNAVFTLMTLRIGLPAYGFGQAASCFVTLFIGFSILDVRLRKLEYITFMQQPIVVPKFKFEKENKV